MARKSAKLTDLPTACRFAVLEVSDEEEEEVETTNKNTKLATTDSNTGAKKKRNRRKKHRNRGQQGGETTLDSNVPDSTIKEDHIEDPADPEWQTWQSKDEQLVLHQFQRDLQAALQASKVETLNQRLTAENQSTVKAKKKEKPVSMSLDEFVTGTVQTTPAETYPPQTNGITSNEISGLDNFLDLEEPLPEKPQKSKPKKKTKSKSENETKKLESNLEKKRVVAGTSEDFIKAEMVHIQEKLEQKDEAVTDLHKTVEQQQTMIAELQKELAQVKKRNKQLCFMLAQGEMKEKSELLMQIEELNEVKEQVVELHGELEQERSRSSSLKQELAKAQSSSRGRHGSTSLPT